MKLTELLFERVSRAQMISVEKFCDALWGKLGIDVSFTKHFLARVNDDRNGKEINSAELIRLFKKEYEQNGKNVAKMDGEAEAVFRDLLTLVNLPFVVKSHGDEKTIVAKTVLRKKDFKSEDPQLNVK
jgi:hypothetical protein